MNHEVSKLPPLPDPSHYVYHDDAAGTEIAPPTPFYTADQVRAFGERCFAISSQRRPESLKSLRDEAQSLLSSASDHLDSLADKKISRAYEWWIGRRDTLVELIEKVDAAPTAALSADREGEAVAVPRELLDALLKRDSVKRFNGECGCINHSRDAEREYESGKCPHQRLRALLAAPVTAKPVGVDVVPDDSYESSEVARREAWKQRVDEIVGELTTNLREAFASSGRKVGEP